MWSANVLSYARNKYHVQVSVEFTNGTQSFIESIDVSGYDPSQVTSSIQNKLSTLNKNDDLEASLAPQLATPATTIAVESLEAIAAASAVTPVSAATTTPTL